MIDKYDKYRQVRQVRLVQTNASNVQETQVKHKTSTSISISTRLVQTSEDITREYKYMYNYK